MDRNEAIKIVRMCCPKITDSKCDFETAMRVLVPELKESDDERIRKFLVDYFECIKSTLNDGIWKGFQIEDILAYIEKQGKEKYALKSFKDEDAHKFVQYIERQAKAYEFNLPNRSYDIYGFAKDIRSWLEKQGELKQGDKVEPTRFRVGDTIRLKGSTAEYTIKTIDAEYHHGKGWLLSISAEDEYELVEQKPEPFKAEHGKYYYCIKDYFSGGKKQASKGDVVQALRGLPIMGLDDASEFFLPVNNMHLNDGIDHSVSPKFKVGDWVVLSSGSVSEILQIVSVGHKWYWFDNDTYMPIVDEDCLRLWHPQDAEVGDILVTIEDGYPFIFKGFLDKSHPDSPVAYGGIIPGGTFDISRGYNWWDEGEISPANKEQRELLFREMKIAGYEWDAGKNKLKKLS